MVVENELMRYGKAKKIAEYLEKADEVSHEELLNALINALHRIQQLEKAMARLEKGL